VTGPDWAIGVDLGGTNLRAGVYRGLSARAEAAAARRPGGGASPEELIAAAAPVVYRKVKVGEPRDPDTVVARVAELVASLAGEAGAPEGPIPVGVGLAAMLRDRRGTVANSPHLRWRDVAFGERLAARLGDRFPVSVYNDVNAIVFGEHGLGAAAGASTVLAVYVGTGIGGGVVVDGRLAEGASNCAGEIGHVKVRWDEQAAPCACGGRGCIEAYAGGSYVQRRIRAELAGGAPSQAVALAGGRVDDVTPGHVDRAAAEGDAWALELWGELAPLLGVTLAGAICLLNPDCLVLGGGMLGRTPVLREQVIAALTVAAPSALTDPLTIVDAILGDDAGLVGSALLALRGVSRI
jgi:glucokinase